MAQQDAPRLRMQTAISSFQLPRTGKPLAVILSGAGISAESGLKTFRDSGGLWENFPIAEVASIEGWYTNPAKVLEFYNLRRAQAAQALPNDGHRALVTLEEGYDVVVITQNVDDLHERAGSEHVLHLHGLLRRVRSCADENMTYDIGAGEIKLGDLADDGQQLRPDIVWFGEEVPSYPLAATIAMQADVFIVVGTSLAVYPAAGLIDHVPADVPSYIVDPHASELRVKGVTAYDLPASVGLPRLVNELLSQVPVRG